MKRVLVTGTTGFLGNRLVRRLADGDSRIHAFYRSEEKIRGWEHENISFFKGSLEDQDSIESAMQGCEQVFHLAAFAAPWARDNSRFDRENVGGTVNILKSAIKQGVKRLVYTSTAGVLGPSNGQLNTEAKKFTGKHYTHYDRTKAMAEEMVREYTGKGLEAVIVNPTRIYGPGILNPANSVTLMIRSYVEGRWKIIPGDGQSIGNYVYIDDVIDCMLLAMKNGCPGERYLAGGENLSFNEFFNAIAKVSGVKHRLYKIPAPLMILVAGTMLGMAWLTGKPPRITPAFIRRYRQDWAVSTEKAERELGYRPIKFEEGLISTLEWMKG
jgi:farnesol dehydrogenase